MSAHFFKGQDVHKDILDVLTATTQKGEDLRACTKLFSTWQEHERTCGKPQISEEVIPEEQPQQDSQVSEK
jgi:hypothetical protein